MIADPITTFSDDELTRMTERAWREAARCWIEARTSRNDPLLVDSARSAEQFWNHLVNEQRRRALPELPVMDPSTQVDLIGTDTITLFLRGES